MRKKTLVLVAGVALVVRLAYLALFMRHYTPNSDADSYYAIGRAVAQGHGYAFTLPFEYVHATAIRPPLYPTVLAGAFRMFGTHVGVAQGVNVAAGCAAAVLAALIAARIGGRRAGLCAGIVVACYPPLIANDVTALVESIAVLLTFALVLLLVDGRTVWAGVVLGLLMLDRASAQWFVVVVAAWVLWRLGWRHSLRMVAVALLVVSPWVVRNAVQVGGPVLVATNGFNLNATYSDEARESGSFVDAYFDPQFATMRANAANEVEFDSQLRSNAVHDLRAHPARLLNVVPTNLAQWLELRPHRNREPERLDGRNLGVRPWTLPGFYIVTAAGLFGLVRARRAAAAQLLLLTAAYFMAVSVATISVPRLRSIFDGCLAVGAGLALAWVLGHRVVAIAPPPVRPVRWRPAVAVIGVIALVGVPAGLWWQADTHDRARHAVAAAIERDGSAVDALARQYRVGRDAEAPPRLANEDVDRLRDLMTVLGERAPQVTRSAQHRVARALSAARVASHEADVISLLSAAEYLDADAQHRQPSLENVRDRYEHDIRPGDPILEPWDAVVSGTSLERLQAAL